MLHVHAPPAVGSPLQSPPIALATPCAAACMRCRLHALPPAIALTSHELLRPVWKVLDDDIRLAEEEEQAYAQQRLSGTARLAEGGGGPLTTSWGVRDTVYFHLLTGKPGSTVRLIGDVLAWGQRRAPPFLRRGHRRAVDTPAELLTGSIDSDGLTIDLLDDGHADDERKGGGAPQSKGPPQ